MDADEPNPKLSPRIITADPRKFSHYVLDPVKADGKDHIFINMLGFRPHSQEDARTLSALYVEQASSRIDAGEYSTSRRDQHG